MSLPSHLGHNCDFVILSKKKIPMRAIVFFVKMDRTGRQRQKYM